MHFVCKICGTTSNNVISFYDDWNTVGVSPSYVLKLFYFDEFYEELWGIVKSEITISIIFLYDYRYE